MTGPGAQHFPAGVRRLYDIPWKSSEWQWADSIPCHFNPWGVKRCQVTVCVLHPGPALARSAKRQTDHATTLLDPAPSCQSSSASGSHRPPSLSTVHSRLGVESWRLPVMYDCVCLNMKPYDCVCLKQIVSLRMIPYVSIRLKEYYTGCTHAVRTGRRRCQCCSRSIAHDNIGDHASGRPGRCALVHNCDSIYDPMPQTVTVPRLHT
jgi:hypothetical protein